MSHIYSNSRVLLWSTLEYSKVISHVTAPHGSGVNYSWLGKVSRFRLAEARLIPEPSQKLLQSLLL
jgi:hypothetical protein